jgi:hypothetical protein
VLRFEWDETKNTRNRRKHGVDFTEAESAFWDDSALLIDDPIHSVDEQRYVLLGASDALRLLVVSHCYRAPAGDAQRRGDEEHEEHEEHNDQEVIRIISARPANPRERAAYLWRHRR